MGESAEEEDCFVIVPAYQQLQWERKRKFIFKKNNTIIKQVLQMFASASISCG